MKNRAFVKKALKAAPLIAAVLCAALSAFMGCDNGSNDPERETYTVTYDTNGGSGAAPSAQTVNAGSSVTVAVQGGLAYSGRTFNGWNTNSAGTGAAYAAGDSLTVSGNIALFAQWASQNEDGAAYVLRPNQHPDAHDYICVADDMLPAGFAVSAGDQVAISFSVKTNVPLSTFTIGIADWTNGGGWTAPGWNDPKEVAADGRYHSVEWTLTASASGPVGGSPLSVQLSADSVSEPEIAIYIKDVSINVGEPEPPAPTQCAVTFDADGGSPATQTRTVNSGETLGSNMPSNPTKSGGYSFGGWYAQRNGGGDEFTGSTTVTGHITVFAKWMSVVPDLSLDAALTWISNNAVEGGEYTIIIKTNSAVAPRELDYGGKTVSVTFEGGASERRVSLSANGAFFKVNSGVTLVMNTGAKIIGNSSSGVAINTGGTFTMSGGVYVYNRGSKGGIFTNSCYAGLA